jgi:tetrahydromethanopterin S-methyltransferase subunit G
MEEIIKIDNRLTKVETKLENVEKKVDTLDAKVEAGHTETEKQIGSLVVCVKEFIATQTKTNV